MLANSWCLEYTRQSSSGTPFEQAQRRQRRYTGLKNWKFQEIVDLLPGLLYLSIILFMIGICDYLIDFHIGLAITTIVIFASGILFAVVTTAASIRYEDCPFRVPLLESAKHLIMSFRGLDPVRGFGDWHPDVGSLRPPGGLKGLLRRASTALQLVLNATLAFFIRLAPPLSALINQLAAWLFDALSWLWVGQDPRIGIGMDFRDDLIDRNDRTVVDSVKWILEYCSEPSTVSAALLLIPDVARAPQHHLELLRAGASEELIRRCSDLMRLGSLQHLGKEYEAVRNDQILGLAYLVHHLMRPLDRWKLPYTSPTGVALRSTGYELSYSVEQEARPLTVAFSGVTRIMYHHLGQKWRQLLDQTSDISRVATIGWLSAIQRNFDPQQRQADLMRLNTLLDDYWWNHARSDFEVNCVYVFALTSYLGYVSSPKMMTLPSYRACLYYCIEHSNRLWKETTDPVVIRSIGFIAIIASNEVWDEDSKFNILQTQLGRSFDRLKIAITAPLDGLKPYRLVTAMRVAAHSHKGHFNAPDPRLAIPHILYFVSEQLGDPEVRHSASKQKLEHTLALLIDLYSNGHSLDALGDILPRCRYLLVQLTAVLKDNDLLGVSRRKSIMYFMARLFQRCHERSSSTTLLEHVIVAGFPHIMRPLLESEFCEVGSASPESMVGRIPDPSSPEDEA